MQAIEVTVSTLVTRKHILHVSERTKQRRTVGQHIDDMLKHLHEDVQRAFDAGRETQVVPKSVTLDLTNYDTDRSDD